MGDQMQKDHRGPADGTERGRAPDWLANRERARIKSGSSPLRGLVSAAVAIPLATAAKLIFGDVIGTPSPFLLYFSVIASVAWYGGRAVGLTAVMVCALLAAYFFGAPGSTLWPMKWQVLVQFAVFLGEGAALAFLVSLLRLQRQRVEASARDAASARDKLQTILQTVDEGITVQNTEGRLVYANDQAARLTGYDSAQGVRRSHGEGVRQGCGYRDRSRRAAACV